MKKKQAMKFNLNTQKQLLDMAHTFDLHHGIYQLLTNFDMIGKQSIKEAEEQIAITQKNIAVCIVCDFIINILKEKQ